MLYIIKKFVKKIINQAGYEVTKISPQIKGNLPFQPNGPEDYNAINALNSLRYVDVTGKLVLVIGCNKGLDCSYFVQSQAIGVYGVDVIDEIGQDYVGNRYFYHKCSAEKMDCFNDNYFDLVYSVATMEHIQNIESAFMEMIRVLKPGGLLYCVAAPLWYSRYGHHKGDLFLEYPWIHLILNKEEIKKWFLENKSKISPEIAKEIDHHVEYMLNPSFFNKRPAKDYVNICNSLGLEIIINSLDLEPREFLTSNYRDLLLDKYEENELLAVTHRVIARKPNNPL